jgi:DNA polymerase-3 subunit alpha
VFQFESSLATEKLRAMRCDRFDDLVAVNALIRPGPLDSGMTDVFIRRKRGFEEVSYPVPELEEALEPTYGVITYQEQVMRVANVLAGFSLAEADVLRKAVGKKDAALTKRVLEEFCERAVEKGLSKKKAREIADLIRTFGRYGFPKAHAVAYAVISYRTAWLKAHYPAEFMAALLSSIIDNTDKVVQYITTARSMGLEVLPPSVSESRYKFTVVDDRRIRFGLGAIKGVGESAIRSISEAREEKPFESLFDFCQRIDLRLNNKRVLECLIASGALDEFGERGAMKTGLETILSEAQVRQRERDTGQESLFGVADSAESREPRLPQVTPLTETKRLKEEKAVLGFYISGHPLERFRDLVEMLALETNTSTIGEMRDCRVELACVVTSMSVNVGRSSGKEDVRGLFAEDVPVLIEGTVSGNSRDEENPPIFVDSVRLLEDVHRSGGVAVCIELREGDEAQPGEFRSVREVLETSPGEGNLYLRWRSEGNGGEPPMLASRSLRVTPSAGLLADLRTLLGSERVHLIRG